jgi:steroid delta-isomerase-like uncharacterized protein
VWNSQNVDLVEEVVAEGFVDHHLPSELPRGPAGMKVWLSQSMEAFPDLHVVIEDVVAEGDKVVTRTTFSGTHPGESMGILATGKRIRISAIAIARIANGQLAEWWENADILGMLQQMGAIPAPSEGS